MRSRVLMAALLTGGSMVLDPASAAQAQDVGVFRFADGRITESSGLVDLGSSMVTTNDSGSRSQLFLVSQVNGRTIGLMNFRADTVDVEALAPAGGGAVWVGDIGDNRGDRRSISVYRVKVAVGRTNPRATRYRLAYPRGGRDAESLFADRTGRLHIITKSLLGGTVFRAPARLSPTRVNRLEPVARVLDFATDAALLNDGRHVIVRGPGNASVYTFPRFQRLGSFALPPQRQGEGISVGPGNRIRLSSEGARTLVQQVSLPAAAVQRMRPPAPAASPSPPAAASPSVSPSPSASSGPSASPSPSPAASTITATPAAGQDMDRGTAITMPDPWLLWSIPGVIALGAVGIGFGLRRSSD